MKERILSGVQPTGELHIGNYLGALKNFVELQDKYECYFIIVDLHSLTEKFDPKEKPQQILDLMTTFLAVGLNPKKCTMFVQSHLPAHTELAWIFNTISSMGELERMTQYKDKAARQKANVNVGLFDYPVLQAADILLYKPAYVPVGQDQLQHLEFTNTIVRRFNHKFGQTFSEIKPYNQKPLRIMSLTDPEKKMSKSEPGSYIGIFEEPKIIQEKIAKAVTATDAPKGEMPKGVKNLFGLMEEFADKATYQKFTKEYENGTIQYVQLKKALAEAIISYFAPVREKKLELIKKTEEVQEIFKKGAEQASKIASQTLTEVKQKVGLI